MEDQNYITLPYRNAAAKRNMFKDFSAPPLLVQNNLCSPPYPFPPASKEGTTLAIGVVSSRPTLGEEIT